MTYTSHPTPEKAISGRINWKINTIEKVNKIKQNDNCKSTQQYIYNNYSCDNKFHGKFYINFTQGNSFGSHVIVQYIFLTILVYILSYI